MANRAYLYPCPLERFEAAKPVLPERYYDSRHTIPIGWFFFFRTSDVVLVNVRTWQEVKLAAPKAAALALFHSRRPVLDRYLPGERLLRAADRLAHDLDRWPGEYLFMDPVEVVEDDLHHKSQFEAILESLDSGRPERMDRAIRPYCASLSDEPDTRVGQVLGYTYWE